MIFSEFKTSSVVLPGIVGGPGNNFPPDTRFADPRPILHGGLDYAKEESTAKDSHNTSDSTIASNNPSTLHTKKVKRMKKYFSLAVAFVALLGVTAFAGDYHRGATLVCNDCHVMHFSQSHSYGDNYEPPALVDGPNEALLRAPVNSLCLTCHDGKAGAPDVLGENFNSYTRNAGALNFEDDSEAGYPHTAGHSLGFTGVIPGSNPERELELECSSCHSVHGSANYRNLGARGASFTVTYNNATPLANDLTKDVFQRDFAHMYDGGANHYATSNIDYNEPGNSGSAYATMCKACHTDFHGNIGGAEYGTTVYDADTTAAGVRWFGFERHPAAFVNLNGSTYFRASSSTRPAAGFAKSLYRPKVMSATAAWGTQGALLPQTANFTSDLTPSCMTCHKSHGNQNPFGLIYSNGSEELSENGTTGGTYAQMCQQCHSMGTVLPGVL
jgi:hypothetical protein